MSTIGRISRSWRRSLAYLGIFGISTVGIVNISRRYRDDIQSSDTFGDYTREQQKKHRFSGMHEPFLTNNLNQLEIFQKHFPEFTYLVPTDVQTLKEKHSLKTPVQIRSLSECPIKSANGLNNGKTVIVGGPPALISGASLIKSEKNLIYLNDERRIPIANGSAWHLEYDAETEGPTSYLPSQFFLNQLMRATFGYVGHQSIEETGFFPWRTLDWIGWISHPEHWFQGLRIAFAYQWVTTFADRQPTMNKVALQCIRNETFFQDLNEQLNNQLLFKGNGSIIVARTDEEVKELNKLKTALTNEGRVLNLISKEELYKRYGFIPNGLIYAEKVHDRVIRPNFMNLLKNYIQQQGGQIINGTLTTIYTDQNQPDGFVEYQTNDGQKHFIPFSRLILSLGSQPILKPNNRPLFDIVAARGVSILAHVYLPTGYKFPPVLVCGETNHATNLTEYPVPIKTNDGKSYDLYLMRLTAGACMTPNVSDQTTANYDGTIAVGLLSAVRNTLGKQCQIQPILVYGCNRQVSQNGQIHWSEPYPNIHVQYGAGGGGLTRAPDFVATS